jgi:hypothetical protein
MNPGGIVSTGIEQDLGKGRRMKNGPKRGKAPGPF